MDWFQLQGKRVLVTGHTGFKGRWLIALLKRLRCELVGYSLDDSCGLGRDNININADIRGDTRNAMEVERVVKEFRPDFVFHLAAEALVSRAYMNPHATWETNVMGTMNVLEAVRKNLEKCVVIIVTSDKCYENNEWVWGYRESDRLGGKDPYSASKAGCEIMVRSYVNTYFQDASNGVRVATGRAGNVIGGGDWSEDRIVPDCIRSWCESKKVVLRNPQATRPWQHVLEPLRGYIELACRLSEEEDLNGEAFNFGPLPENSITVARLVEEMKKTWTDAEWESNEGTRLSVRESGLLALSCEKAATLLNWRPVLSIEETASITARWYLDFTKSSNSAEYLYKRDIEDYVARI